MLGACRFSCIAVKPVLTLLDRRLITLPAWPEFKVTLEGAEKEEEEWVRRRGGGGEERGGLSHWIYLVLEKYKSMKQPRG